MDCLLHYSTIPHLPIKKPTQKSHLISLPLTKFNIPESIPFSPSSRSYQDRTSTTALASTSTRTTKTDSYNVRIKTLDGCKIGFSHYCFEYNADGGKGAGHTTKFGSNGDLNDRVSAISFDPKTVYIPPVTSATTKMYGLPLPPFLKIEIVPEVLQGSINEESGKIDIKFRAKYWFSIGDGYKAPPLIVDTILTSDESRGARGSTRGKRRGKDGSCRLVGIATLEPLKDNYMNSLLGLPAECVTEMNAIIYFN